MTVQLCGATNNPETLQLQSTDLSLGMSFFLSLENIWSHESGMRRNEV